MKENFVKVLAKREAERIIDSHTARAAVLVPIFCKNGELHVLFTKRTETVEHHKGQISFPGGKKDDTDESLLATALRESLEEIGLESKSVEILGELDEERTIVSDHIISPFVGVIPYPYPSSLSTWEVAELVEVPLKALLNRDNLKEETITEKGISTLSYSYYIEDRIIWGATARIMKRFLERVYDNGDFPSC